jgi:hypothetical protein
LHPRQQQQQQQQPGPSPAAAVPSGHEAGSQQLPRAMLRASSPNSALN